MSAHVIGGSPGRTSRIGARLIVRARKRLARRFIRLAVDLTRAPRPVAFVRSLALSAVLGLAGLLAMVVADGVLLPRDLEISTS